jgi:hypothetical protein
MKVKELLTEINKALENKSITGDETLFILDLSGQMVEIAHTSVWGVYLHGCKRRKTALILGEEK